ncbi:MAG: hypothetical protein ACK8QZ_05950, partial [Anaerolineales bacterium]
DLPMSWIRYELGPEAMTRYFSTNRPVWGLLYQLTTRLFPQVPIYWQIFALFWRWATAVLFWLLLRRLWPEKEELAFWASAFFLLYPGFNQQWVAYLYSHFFIVLSLFLFSLFAMLQALERGDRHYTWRVTALLTSALNLWMMEYFFFLELVRPFLLGAFLLPRKKSWKEVGYAYFPYGLLWLVAVLWRMFIFNNQVYKASLLERLQSSFFPTVWELAQTILVSLKVVLVDGWLRLLPPARLSVDGKITTLTYWGVVILALLAMSFFLWPRRGLALSSPSWLPVLLGRLAILVGRVGDNG